MKQTLQLKLSQHLTLTPQLTRRRVDDPAHGLGVHHLGRPKAFGRDAPLLVAAAAAFREQHAALVDQVLIDVSDQWTSPRGGRYPSRWRVRVPSTGLDVEVHPVLADQELGTRPRYWEGAVDLRGKQSGREIAGRGYVELVGYDE